MERLKMIIPESEVSENKGFCVGYRDNLYDYIENTTTKAFLSIISGLGGNAFDSTIKNYNLLESFIFSNIAKPKYSQGDFVILKNTFIERIPNEELYVKIAGVILDYSKCEILYYTEYHLDDSYAFKIVEESKILGVQRKKPYTKNNYYGRDELERFQYLKDKQRMETI